MTKLSLVPLSTSKRNNMICCLNGKFLKEKYAKISVMDHGFLYSDGFYDTMKSFNGTILDLELHLKRVEKSLKKLTLKLPWRKNQVRSWINKTALLNKHPLARVRLTITRGCNNFDFNAPKNPTLVITAESIEIDEKIYEKGVAVFTLPMVRILPEVKIIGVTGMILSRRILGQKKAFEALFIDGNFVREGSITNVFIVKNDKLHTPKSKILKGITRHEVMQIAKKNRLKVVERDIKIEELFMADEIFLTNTKFGVVPVVSADRKKIGTGKVGAVSKQIMKAFNYYVESYLKAHR